MRVVERVMEILQQQAKLAFSNLLPLPSYLKLWNIIYIFITH